MDRGETSAGVARAWRDLGLRARRLGGHLPAHFRARRGALGVGPGRPALRGLGRRQRGGDARPRPPASGSRRRPARKARRALARAGGGVRAGGGPAGAAGARRGRLACWSRTAATPSKSRCAWPACTPVATWSSRRAITAGTTSGWWTSATTSKPSNGCSATESPPCWSRRSRASSRAIISRASRSGPGRPARCSSWTRCAAA